MSDLISRKDIFPNGVFIVNNNDPMKSLDELINRIWQMEAVDAVPVVHGRWIEKKRWSMGKWQKWLECSVCGHQDHNLNMYEDMPFTAPSNYCPNCGAKMDGGNDG